MKIFKFIPSRDEVQVMEGSYLEKNYNLSNECLLTEDDDFRWTESSIEADDKESYTYIL